MNLIRSSAEYIPQEPGLEGVYKQIEMAARTCYSEDTEVLTNNGWKFFSKVSDNDKVLTFIPETNEMTWDIPNIVCKEINDSMIEITHPNIKLCVTKDHRIYQSIPEKRKYDFILASQIAGLDKMSKSNRCRFRIPKYFINSKRSSDCISIPTINYKTIVNGGNGRFIKKEITIEVTKDFMVIAGAFIAEGHTNNHSKQGCGSNCQITQKVHSPLYNNVINALNNLKWSYRINHDPRKPEVKWIIINGGIVLVELFDKLFGKGSKNKHLPPWFRQLPDDYLETMLKNMYLGDGSHTKTRKERYLSISKRLLEEVQEAFILLGKNASFIFDENMSQKCTVEESMRDSWIIRRDKHVKILPVEKRKVYCTSTNSGIIHIRYKGKTCWCGNCYKSEAKCDGTYESAKKFVDKLIERGHTAMLEHGTVYLKIALPKDDITPCKSLYHYKNNPYSKYININGYTFITTNYRILQENNWLDDLQYICNPEEQHVKRYTLKLVTSIGIVRELLRHRVFSFANESTRYCNYSKNSFNQELVFVIPEFIKKDHRIENTIKDPEGMLFALQHIGNGSDSLKWFLEVCDEAERAYLNSIKLNTNIVPQQAREVLPLCTKSELIMTGFASDWRHFFDLRLFGKTGEPHPDMKILAEQIKEECVKAGIWRDIDNQPSKF